MNTGPAAPVASVKVNPREAHATAVQPAADAAAAVLLGLLVFLLLCFALGALALARRSRRHKEREPEGSVPVKLPNGSPASDPTVRADWERDADWWKKSS